MRKYLVTYLFTLFFLGENTAQEGIFAIARYDSVAPPKFNYKDSLSEFTGGFTAFKNLFLKEFKMPVEALRTIKAPDGMVGFTVNLVGKIVDIEIIDSTHAKIDAEVIRVLSEIAEFHPQPKPLKFAILYNVYPDWFRDFVVETEQAQKEQAQAMKMDSLLKSKTQQDLSAMIDHSKGAFNMDIWFGFSNMNDPLSKYLKSTAVFGGDLNFMKKKWLFGGSLQVRSTRLKQDFENIDAFWAKDTSVSLFSMALAMGYQVVDEERLAFTPFVGIGFGVMSLPSNEDYASPDGSSLSSFVPSFGFLVDYKYKIKAQRAWLDAKLNTKSIRLRLAVNPMNFRDGRRGNVVDIGVGLSFMQQNLKL
ncbi:MAG: hypothetical protein JNL70_22105 [Saprospiraceae bacterium]|nr:hypothetical protein [Saprospiraceae bacterium]